MGLFKRSRYIVILILSVWVVACRHAYVDGNDEQRIPAAGVVAVASPHAEPPLHAEEQAMNVLREIHNAEAQAVREVMHENDDDAESGRGDEDANAPRIRSMNDLLQWALSHHKPAAVELMGPEPHENLNVNVSGAAYQKNPSKVEAFYKAMDNIDSETDIMQHSIQTLAHANTTPEKDALDALDVLEELCHQIDNAVFLSSTGGFKTLQPYLRRSDSEALSASVALTLASCAQNNPQVIVDLVDLNVLSDLLAMLLEGTLPVKARSLLLCAAILDFPYAHAQAGQTVRKLIPMSLRLMESFGARSDDDVAAQRVVRRSLDVLRLILLHQPESRTQLESRDKLVVQNLVSSSTSKAVQESAAELSLFFTQR